MYTSETLVNNLAMEIDTLNCRLKNIKDAYSNTTHNGLRERLIYENKIILLRVNEIFSTALLLEKRTKEKISLSNLLLEKCRRTISEKEIQKNLFYL